MPTTTPASSEFRLVLEQLVAKARRALPSEPTPCFAHLRVRSQGRERDYLLGPRTVVTDEVTVLHWQQAPLAGVFFARSEGEDYEFETEGRTIEGTVLARTVLHLEHGQLKDLGPVRDPRWGEPLLPRDPSVRLQRSSPADVPLDEAQRSAAQLPSGEALLVLGEAGAGKTTVALHRLAYLARNARNQPFHALVLVPTEGLRRLYEHSLERLGVHDVEVAAFDVWAAQLARRAFSGLPRRESESTSHAVLHLKRHRALRTALQALAAKGSRRGPRVRREDLLALFGSPTLLEGVVRASEGTLDERSANAVRLHTRAQFRATTEEQFSQVVDAARLESLDGRGLDEGTPDEDAASIDPEDYPVLFELDRLRARARGEAPPRLPRTYDCVVLDEAQELGPWELALAGRALRPEGTLVVAGDAAQQVDSTACFLDWDTTMRDLGAPRHRLRQLFTSYRCPPEVTTLARKLRGVANAQPEAPTEGSSRLVWSAFSNRCHELSWLTATLQQLTNEDPGASVAVLARTREEALRLGAIVPLAVPARVVLDGDFRFSAGIQVTCLEEVKGLEFDLVVLPDASSSVYGRDGEARNALYVAVTRASHQLALHTVGSWSPLLERS